MPNIFNSTIPKIPSNNEDDIAQILTQNIDHEILIDLHKVDKPDSPIIEVDPYALKPAISELLNQYINHQDFHIVDSPAAERLTIIVNNPILFSEFVFKYPELKRLT